MREVEAGISLSGDIWGAPGWDVLEIITSSSADGITIQDATGTLIYANDAAARMSGFVSGQDMQRASAEEIVHAMFRVLGKHVTAGEVSDVVLTLPDALVDLVRERPEVRP